MRLGHTPPFRDPRGGPLPGSVATVEFLRLGGALQWVMIRGESAANPVLILLHGGPGFSETALFRHHNAALEYFDALQAPSKELVWFERSGHEPFADEAAGFNAAMIEKVRPIAVAS